MSTPTPKKTMSSTLQNMKFMQRRQVVPVDLEETSGSSGDSSGKSSAAAGIPLEEQWHLEYDADKEEDKAGLAPSTKVIYHSSYLSFTNPLDKVEGETDSSGDDDSEEEGEEEKKDKAARNGAPKELPVGRHSYREFNPEVERIRKEMQERGKTSGAEEDVGVVEMVNALGKGGGGGDEDGSDIGARGARYRPASKKRKGQPNKEGQGEGGSSKQRKMLDRKGFMKP
ncbi:hypothetical protein BJ684DRAFT_16700 [Piptocephalis cylindrospora]|uniref:Uncharacterized protein n=1 Tax=Piptocephalis cylindrospora TaxID=1907219 RepID=A0A4V1IY03_9FUNG|nr:hypothetical protein BJ684DRAFT_16700 [Piptocephalis cylindrospora]|eukprot:RKP12859.1 hypothetical protein BJ684DRAFT_16700 [Piptocephalis cylindrospora]